MKAAILLEHIALYPVLRRFRFKKDAKHIQGTPLLVDFQLWGQWYVLRTFGGLLCADGREMPFHQMHATDGNVVVGRQDLAAAEGTPYAMAWRESYATTINERLAVH